MVLGVGSNFGAQYKKYIIQTIRPHVRKLYLCELSNNTLINTISDEYLVDQIITISSYENAQHEISAYIKQFGLKLNAIVSYRDEWLEICAKLNAQYNLSLNNLSAIQNVQNKAKALALFKELNVINRNFSISSKDKLSHIQIFPVLIKPVKGMRSEWVRFIYNKNDLELYIKDVSNIATISTFLVEEVIVGHEIDIDIVMYNQELLYAETSDNFPTYKPYALETGHLMPSILSGDLQEKIRKYSYDALLGTGHRSGVFHIEMIITPNHEIELIEINARVGGMYIPMWHKIIYGVDLIKATLAIACGDNPQDFIRKHKAKMALAQLCVTSNSKENSGKRIIQNIQWDDYATLKKSENIVSISKWISGDTVRDIALNGHVNIGEITTKGDTPIRALYHLQCFVNNEAIAVSINDKRMQIIDTPLKEFGRYFDRYKICKGTDQDIPRILQLLSLLTKNAKKGQQNNTMPSDITILLVKDMYCNEIIGTTSIHILSRLRCFEQQKTSYIHDLVIAREYQSIGLGTLLLSHALQFSKDNNVHKIELASENGLKDFYGKHGFQESGLHFVQYNI